jgi:DNA-binding NarL/FixJ family response regulator
MNLTSKPDKVIIADSQFLITESLKVIVEADCNLEVYGIIWDKTELLKALQSESVSLLVVDPFLTDFSGISELKELKVQFRNLKILVLTNCVTRSELHELNSAGIVNVLLKTEGKEEVISAISATMKSRKYYSNELLGLLFDQGEKHVSGTDTFQLTNSEIEIVRLISEGFTTKEIASRKFISFHTVISHRKNIFRKLSVTSVSELIMVAIRYGLINTIEYHI